MLLAAATGEARPTSPSFCLPPVFDGGRRLHESPAPSVVWLEPLLRQHEICWYAAAHPDELRIFVYGNSAVFGFPLPVEETLGPLLNRQFPEADIPAHLFNLGFVAAYQIKDALIIHESLKYQPDVIVYALTLSEFNHVRPEMAKLRTPQPGAEVMRQFIGSNARELAAFAEERPAGLAAALEAYRSLPGSSAHACHFLPGDHLRQLGALVRTAVHLHARSIRTRLFPNHPAPQLQTRGRQSRYDCAHTKSEYAQLYRRWTDWNVLTYLRQIHQTLGIPIVVVNWPVAHEPIDDCYNVRYPSAALQQFNNWMERETRTRGMYYVNLQTLLPADDFLDSLHVSARGHRKIAYWLGRALHPLLLNLRGESGATALAQPTP